MAEQEKPYNRHTDGPTYSLHRDTRGLWQVHEAEFLRGEYDSEEAAEQEAERLNGEVSRG